jgi:hypothetical protein
MASVNDKIGMLGRNFGVPHPGTLQTAGINESPGTVTLRIFKKRTGITKP